MQSRMTTFRSHQNGYAALAILMALAFTATLRADLILTRDGKAIACRLLREDDVGIHVVTGEPSGPREVALAHSEILTRLMGADEIAHIEACKEAPKLAQWSAAYYHAGYETMARRSLRRALQLDRKLGEQPMAARSEATPRKPATVSGFSRFWNQVVARERATSIAPRDAAAWVSAAKWAHRAGLAAESADCLRRAWRADSTIAEITELALAWGVRLESWISFDLTPAIEGPLFIDSIRDEGVFVSADPEMQFVYLPLRYEPEALSVQAEVAPDTYVLSRNTFKGRDARGFYGLQPLISRANRVRIGGELEEPVYERMSFKQGEGRRLMVEMRNHFGPRPPDPQTGDRRRTGRIGRQPRIKTTTSTERASGWAVAIFEIPKHQVELRIEVANGGEQVLDLEFIRQAGVVSLDFIRDSASSSADGKRGKHWPWSAAPDVIKAMKLAEGTSPAMAALAIERLARIRRLLEMRFAAEIEPEMKRWSTLVDPVIISAAVRGEDQVRLAAWRYFCRQATLPNAPVPPMSLSRLAQAEPDLQLVWVRLLSCGLRLEACGHWWRPENQLTSFGQPVDEATTDGQTGCSRCAARLLEAILQSDDAFVCYEAIDVMLSLPPGVTDWRFLEHASPPAQRYALARVGEIASRESATRLLQALVLSARPELAQDVAQAAHYLEMSAKDTETAILSQWWSLDSPDRKPAFLKVLEGIHLGDTIYGKRFAAIIEESLHGENQLRELAWNLLITQLNYRRAHVGAESLSLYISESDQRLHPHGPYPMMIDPASTDPLIHGIVQAAVDGPETLRRDALTALLDAGYADQVAQCLLAPALNVAQRDQLLNDLLTSGRLADRDATLALAGRLLQPKFAGHAARILKYLDEYDARTPADKKWRMHAAIKAGVHIEEMEALVARSPAPVAADLRRWIFRLCHMSPQDRQRLASAKTPDERADRLAQINLRRGQLVDGEYGVLAIVVTTRQIRLSVIGMDGPSPLTGRWMTPRRVTVELPNIRLTAADTYEDYQVRWQDRVIGKGQILQQAMPIRGPRAYLPVLRASPVWWSLSGYLAPGIDPETSDEGAYGPLRLPSLRVLTKPAPGTMTITISELLRAGLAEAAVYPSDELDELVPDDLGITLRYGVFGSFSGCGKEILPGVPSGGMLGGPEDEDELKRRHLLNVMLVIERIGDDNE